MTGCGENTAPLFTLSGGWVVIDSLVAGGPPTVNAPDVADVKPVELNVIVAVPGPLTRRFENVATPPTAWTDVVPAAAPPPFATTVTVFVAVVTSVLVASRISTTGGGTKFTPVVTPVGGVVIARAAGVPPPPPDALTTIGAEPWTPSAVAVMFVVPAATAVTAPCDVTVATAVFPEDQETGRSVRTLLLTSFRIAVAGVVPPTVREELPSVTMTAATPVRTVRTADPETPSLVAEMVVVPVVTACT
jgi:hypothetical protein